MTARIQGLRHFYTLFGIYKLERVVSSMMMTSETTIISPFYEIDWHEWVNL